MDKIVKKSVTALEKKPRAKCRKWRLRIGTGKSEKSRRFTGTYTQALEALSTFVKELDKQSVELTFSDHAQDWLRRRRIQGELTGDLSFATDSRYVCELKVLNEEFADDLLENIDQDRAESGLLAIKMRGGKGVKVLSGTYMNQLYTMFKRILEDAFDRELITKNPLKKVKAPKVDASKRHALDRETFARFLSALDSLPLDSHTIGIRLAILAGLRRGEIIGLQWRDVDPGLLRIRRAFEEKSGQLKTTKTPSGIRDVPMVEQLEDALQRWKTIQHEMLRSLRLKQNGDTQVVSSSCGGIMHSQNFDRWWRERRDMYGLEGVVLHEMRHTYLTLLASEGVPSNVLKSLAGWSSIKMADTYVHNDDRANNEAAQMLGNVINFELEKTKKRHAI